MKQIIFFVLMLTSAASFAQENLHEQYIRVSGGHSFTGSGDLGGFIYGAEYSKYFGARTSWSAGFNGFIYDGEEFAFAPNAPNRRSNGGLRHATAGVQVTGHFGYSVIKSPRHDFQFRVGPLVKYQTTSLDGYSVTYPVVTGYPEPVFTFYNQNPQRTIAAGVSLQALYFYTIRNKITIGALAGGQMDSDGDLITQLGLTLGRKF